MFNGSGAFSIDTTGNPVQSGTTIDPTVHNATLTEIATGLSTAVCKDGQTTVTADLPMSNHKFTGMSAGTARTDSASLATIQDGTGVYCGTVGGSANTITLSLSPPIPAYVAGQTFCFIAASANTGAVTVNISGLGAKTVATNVTTALVPGDIVSGMMVQITYDGTRFVMHAPATSGWFNVKKYDATGDGVTDDYAAFIAAMTAAGLGGTIYIPKGVYNLSQTLTISEALTFVGDGVQNNASKSSATILRATHSNGDVVRITSRNVTMRDIEISSTDARYTGAAGSNYGLRLEGTDTGIAYTQRLFLERVRVTRQPNHGLLLIGHVQSSTLLNVDVDNIKHHGIVVNDGYVTGRTYRARPGQVNIINARVHDTDGHSVLIGDNATAASSQTAPYRIFIDNLEAFYNALDVTKRYNAYNAFFVGENITFEHSAVAGITPSIPQGNPGSSVTGGIYVAGKNIRLVNNRFIDTLMSVVYIDSIGTFPTLGVRVDGAFINNLEFGPGYYNPAIFIHASAKYVTIDVPKDSADVGTIATSGAGFYTAIDYDDTLDIQRNFKIAGSISSPSGPLVISSRMTAPSLQLEPSSLSLNDNQAAYLSFDGITRGIIVISGNTLAAKGAIVFFRVGDTSNHATIMSSSGTGVAGQTGTLTGTTGIAGNLTIAADSATNRLYIENRTGSFAKAYMFTVLSAEGGVYTGTTTL